MFTPTLYTRLQLRLYSTDYDYDYGTLRTTTTTMTIYNYDYDFTKHKSLPNQRHTSNRGPSQSQQASAEEALISAIVRQNRQIYNMNRIIVLVESTGGTIVLLGGGV